MNLSYVLVKCSMYNIKYKYSFPCSFAFLQNLELWHILSRNLNAVLDEIENNSNFVRIIITADTFMQKFIYLFDIVL